MSAPVAVVDRVSFAYPGAGSFALREESWEIDDATISVVIGRSGSGKSSLLRCLNGLVPHFSGGSFAGSVRIGGLDTRRHLPRDLGRVVGFVFQDPENQMLTDRVESDVAFSLEQAGVDRATMRLRVDHAMEITGIGHLATRRPMELSGGERQRVAIAASLAMQPSLLVLDEPTSQLDPDGAAQIVEAIADLRRKVGLSVVIAEHRLEHLLGVADVLKVMGDGAMTGSPRMVVSAIEPTPLPATARLARELGMPDIPLSVEAARRLLATTSLSSLPVSQVERGGDVLTRVAGVAVALAGRTVLQDTTLDVREGELVALVGPNGSGKTTLLRTIAGLQSVNRGEVGTLGRNMRVSHPAGLGGQVGYVPQQATAIFMRERLDQEFPDPGGQAMRETLAQLGLAGFASRHPMDLSGGERERAALAVVVARGPRLLLLDEPTRGMDAWRKRELAAYLTQLRQTGVGIVMATHDVDLVAACATRVIALDRGRIRADGDPRDILPGSPSTTTQINQVFGGGWLTVAEVVTALDRQSAPTEAG
ncbi:MAG TPA: ATP-binding cassette domain-containing protein [Thermomicrobiales bacterium]|nr:ATP-binding cassette domain-containing protein [Thermomicrobiales bacterium]